MKAKNLKKSVFVILLYVLLLCVHVIINANTNSLLYPWMHTCTSYYAPDQMTLYIRPVCLFLFCLGAVLFCFWFFFLCFVLFFYGEGCLFMSQNAENAN